MRAFSIDRKPTRREVLSAEGGGCRWASSACCWDLEVAYVDAHGWFSLVKVAAYGIVFLGLPHLFELTKRSTVDRWLGDLSYPVYLAHYPLVSLASAALAGTVWVEPGTPFVMIASLAAAVGLLLLVDRPIDAMRQRCIRRAASRDAGGDRRLAWG